MSSEPRSQPDGAVPPHESPVRQTQQRELPRSPLVAGNQAEHAAQPYNPPLSEATNPVRALVSIRMKMERVADEFASGKINRAQFNAVYRRYSDQRYIIERLLERDPQSDAWKQVVASHGQTGFLRAQHQAKPIWFAVFAQMAAGAQPAGSTPAPSEKLLMADGEAQPDFTFVLPVLRRVRAMRSRPPSGLGRLMLPGGGWLLVATGDLSITCAAFSQEPAIAQARWVRDLHADFERANSESLSRGWLEAERMVFPQRGLIE